MLPWSGCSHLGRRPEPHRRQRIRSLENPIRQLRQGLQQQRAVCQAAQKQAEQAEQQASTIEKAYPEYPETRATTPFVRSHELEILRAKNGGPSLETKVMHGDPAPLVVKARLSSEAFGVVLNVDLPWGRYTELWLWVGDRACVAPRQVWLFDQEYAI
jgi:hypothetical protein